MKIIRFNEAFELAGIENSLPQQIDLFTTNGDFVYRLSRTYNDGSLVNKKF